MDIKSNLREGKGYRHPYISLWDICINKARTAAVGIVSRELLTDVFTCKCAVRILL